MLVGRPAGSLRESLAEARPLPVAPSEIAVGIPADALRQRPDVRAAEFTLQAEIARSAEREADRQADREVGREAEREEPDRAAQLGSPTPTTTREAEAPAMEAVGR